MPITTVSIGVDGPCLLLGEGGYRQAIVGTLSLDDDLWVNGNTRFMWRQVLNMDEPPF